MCVYLQSQVPGAERSPHIIGGSELLVHSRGKNTDLDEWLKDAAEVMVPTLSDLFLSAGCLSPALMT